MPYENIPLIEPIAISDTYASGLARIEDFGATMRFTFCAIQHPICGGAHDLERVVVLRLVMPREAASSAAMMAIAAADTDVFLQAH